MKKTLQRLGVATVGLSLCLWSCKEQDKMYNHRKKLRCYTFLQKGDLLGVKPVRESNKGARSASTLGYNSNQYLYLVSLYCYDVSVYESWAKGGPEIQMRVFGALFGATSLSVFRDTGEMGFPRLFPLFPLLNTSIFYWDATVRDAIKFSFVEVDGGALKEINIGISYKITDAVTLSLGSKFDTGENDDIIGEYLVNKDAPAPYDLGGYQCYDVNPNFFFSLRN